MGLLNDIAKYIGTIVPTSYANITGNFKRMETLLLRANKLAFLQQKRISDIRYA